MKLSIIIPIFNEKKTIEEILDRVRSVKLPNGIKKEIIVVDDGSTDSSVYQLTDKIQKSKFVKLIFHQKNLGKGAAIRSGLKKATGDLIIIQDADLEYNPQDYRKLLAPILEDNAQVVYGTRLTNYPLKLWGQHKTVMPFHLLANRFLTTLTNILYDSNLTDMETCYKLFRREVLEKISIKSNRFNFEPEITAKILKQHIPIIEIPIKVTPRTYNEGKKIRWHDGIWAIFTLIRYRFYE